MEQKNKPGKHTKIKNIENKQLFIQEYLLEENLNTELSKAIFKMREKTLEIKDHKKWKYENILCVGCSINIETEKELLECPGFCEGDEASNEDYAYSVVFGEPVSGQSGQRNKKEVKSKIKIFTH